MSSKKYLSVFLLATLFYNVAKANLDPTKYTVTFKYNNEVDWCLGGIIDEDVVVTSADCFVYSNGDFVNYTSLKALIGPHELDVQQVILFDFEKPRKVVNRTVQITFPAVHDFAVVKLKQKFNLADNGLIALKLVNEFVDENSVVFASDEENNVAEEVTIADDNKCPTENEISFFYQSQLCVNLPNNGVCYHQAGSPLVDGNHKLIGIYSECYDYAPYEIFAKVSFFYDWIKEALTSDLSKDGKFESFEGSFRVKNY